MLYEKARKIDLESLFKNKPDYHPFPVYRERDAWDSLEQDVKQVWIRRADELLDYSWPALRMEYYLLLKRTGDMQTAWRAFCERRSALGIFLIAECMEGKGRYMDQIINGIFAVCEETSWLQSLSIKDRNFALPNEEDNYVDLCSSETAQLFAWILYLLGDELDAECGEIRKRMNREVYRRVISQYIERDDYWWMGFVDTRINNWNPWCNMNILMACAFMDFDPGIKAKAVEKVTRSLDQYFEQYPDDGACDEGPMYWGAAGAGLGICIELLKGMSGGAVDGSGIDKLRRIGAYFYKVHIDKNWFVNYADGDARVDVPASVFRFGRLIKDEKLTRLGAAAKSPEPRSDNWFQIYGYLAGIFDKPRRDAADSGAPYILQSYFKDCEILCAREKEGGAEGFFLSAKGGNNLESHNHNDVGSFIVYLDGKPLFIDMGTEEYRLQTFSKNRFDLWYLQSQYHNCPTIAGTLQSDGRNFRARDVQSHMDDGCAWISMDLVGAYPGEKAAVWRRKITLTRGGEPYISIADDYELAKERAGTVYNFMTLSMPVAGGGYIAIDCGQDSRAILDYDRAALDADIEEIALSDPRLARNWGEKVYRIVLREKQPVKKARREFTVRRG